jgi:hypothetical protein
MPFSESARRTTTVVLPRVSTDDHLRYAQEANSLQTISGLVLLLSVVSALTVNFPWFSTISVMLILLVAIAVVMVGNKLRYTVVASKAECDERRREIDKEYGPPRKD